MQHLKTIPLKPEVISILDKAYQFTENKINIIRRKLRVELKHLPFKSKITIIAVGSFGRYEASEESDLDVYIIYKKGVQAEKITPIINIIKTIAKENKIQCSSGFEPILLETMKNNIGGKEDTNNSITNRILFLLESECLYNPTMFKQSYNSILNKYLHAVNHECKLPRFLLSDIIRYYRTICVDYEFKIGQLQKDWAIRNIKLRFSRKALFMGGVLILLQGANKDCHSFISNNLRLPFVKKIALIIKENNFINSKHSKIIDSYSEFLLEISKKEVRRELKQLKKKDKNNNKLFKRLSENSKIFNKSLWMLLTEEKVIDKHIDYLIL